MKEPAGHFYGGKAQGWLPTTIISGPVPAGAFKALNVAVRGS